MQVLTIHYDPETQFCPLEFRYNRRFQDLLRSGIKPASYRKFNHAKQSWSVHISRLPLVIAFGKRYFAHVDYSTLPEHLQIEIVQRLQSNNYREDMGPGPAATASIKTPHQILHLLPSAPPEVVKAAYRALAQLHHPDHGGNEEDFKVIQKAYESLVAGRSSK